jgi:hypothetical protein
MVLPQPERSHSLVLPIVTGPFKHCPNLSLEHDPETSALYLRTDHTCIARGGRRIPMDWQQRHCFGDEYVSCPFYAADHVLPLPRPQKRVPIPEHLQFPLTAGLLALFALLYLALAGWQLII